MIPSQRRTSEKKKYKTYKTIKANKKKGKKQNPLMLERHTGPSTGTG